MYQTFNSLNYLNNNIFLFVSKSNLFKTILTKNISICSKRFTQNVNLKEDAIRIAVIGSGPSGFYTTQQLLKDPRVLVDIYEKYPVPFGLVRFGVAPDHQDVKNVINSFTTTALNTRTTFIGNVSIGTDITLSEIREAYNAVVLCYGAAQDRLLAIDGEHVPNVISARRFVGWYNGVPDDRQLDINLDCETAVIIGHGNVAIDCARILLTQPKYLIVKSDITEHSLQKLKDSKIKCVYIIGRRGPLHVSFTIKEFRELTKLENCKTIIDSKVCEQIQQNIESLGRPRKRLTELIIKISKESALSFDEQRKCFIKFFLNPKAIKGNKEGVSGVVFSVNKLETNQPNCESVVTTDQTEEIECGLVLRSIGYKTISIDPFLPFDEKKGTILNESGRVLGYGPALYCSGWAGTGATGVILNTMTASFEVANNILNDIKTGKITITQKTGNKSILEKLESKQIKVVYFDNWKKIDEMEQYLGSTQGKPREKIVDIDKMVEIAKK